MLLHNFGSFILFLLNSLSNRLDCWLILTFYDVARLHDLLRCELWHCFVLHIILSWKLLGSEERIVFIDRIVLAKRIDDLYACLWFIVMFLPLFGPILHSFVKHITQPLFSLNYVDRRLQRMVVHERARLRRTNVRVHVSVRYVFPRRVYERQHVLVGARYEWPRSPTFCVVTNLFYASSRYLLSLKTVGNS